MELLQAINRTVYPDGKTVVYKYGMIPEPQPVTKELSHKITVWMRWLKIMKCKYNWIDNQPKFQTMKLEFAKYYDITDVAKQHNKEYNTYEKVFICVDTHDYWLVRILKGYRNDDDEGYVEDADNYILERNNIAKQSKRSMIETYNQLLKVLDEDDFSNWDVENCDTIEEAIEMIDGGFGIGEYKQEFEL